MYFVMYHIPTSQYLVKYFEQGWHFAENVNEATILKENLKSTGPIPFVVTPKSITEEIELEGICAGGMNVIPVLKSDLQAHEVRVQFVKML
jgi:hypothetical protein